MPRQLVVTGGGAAGFFCAVNAARLHPGLQVIILEKTGKLLSKVKVSGGGRCNVTHACYSIAEMSKHYPRGAQFVKKAFTRFFTTDTIQWFEERGIQLKTEPDGRMFPVTDTSQTIIDCMMQEVNRYGVEIRLNSEVKAVTKAGESWEVALASNEVLRTDYICIACGGYAKPAMFSWLIATGHTFEQPVPSLFTFNMPGNAITALMGVAVEQAGVKITGTKMEQEGPLLITHWGLSGPAVLKLSAWAARELAEKEYSFNIMVSWVPHLNEHLALQQLLQIRHTAAPQKIINSNPFKLPHRLWEFLLKESAIDLDMRWAHLPAKAQNRLVKYLCAHEFTVKGKTTFKEEFVTAGGIHLDEVDAVTMMSKRAAGLYFAGEIINVDGVTGGYNFQHAWTSGYLAAAAIAAAAG